MVAEIIAEMRAVKPSMYNTAQFFDSLAATDLPPLVAELTRRGAFFRHQHHQVVQQRLLSIQDNLAEILVRWTPKGVVQNWRVVEGNYVSPNASGYAGVQLHDAYIHAQAEASTYPKLTPADFLKLLRRFDRLLPRGETPTCVFMLYNFGTYKDAWNRWLAAAIDTIPTIPVRLAYVLGAWI